MSVIPLPKNAAASLKELGPLQEIPIVRQLGVFALAAAAIALGLWLFFWTQKPDYVPVFAGLDASTSAEASDLLRSANIPFRLEPGSGALAVPSDQVGPARLALASAGLPGDATGGGFEAFQGDQGFGTSQFVESARYQHAMEVELARTIATLRPVREARVHLAIPKPSAFTRERQPASASVVLNMAGGATLERTQVNAIVHLVANSIPMLAPDRVTVVDHLGRMLSDPDPGSEDSMGARRFEQQRRQESVYVQRIQELLAPMTGPGRVSAQVSVDMDFAETEQAREQYGPDLGVVRSEQTSESSQGALEPATGGVPGSASNTPGAAQAGAAADPAEPAAADPAAPQPQAVATGPSARTAVRNYEVDRTLTHTRQAPGRITRVTAAVLVDNVPAPSADGGAPAYRALTPEELQRVETLVQQAIGFDARRGDMVSVVNAAFAPVHHEEPAGPPVWESPKARELLRITLGGIALLVLILAVLRPAFRQMLSPRRDRAPVATLMADEEIPVALSSPRDAAKPKLSGEAVDAPMDFDEKLQVARTAVGSDPRRVANVVRNWMESDE